MSENLDDFQALMTLVRDGSPEAAAHVLKKYGGHVLRVVRRKLSGRMRRKYDSQDFTQEVWAAFFTQEIKERDFESPDALRAFLATVAKNKLWDAYRKRMICEPFNILREKSLEGSAAAAAAGLSDGTPRPIQVAMVNENWDRLKRRADRPGKRILEMLKQGLDYAEIARLLAVNERTVRRVVSRFVAHEKPSS